MSWSGDLSREVAGFLVDFLAEINHMIKPWHSPKDINAGDQWFIRIQDGLQKSEAVLVILTADNLQRPWLFFEAGAMINKFGKTKDDVIWRSRIVPVLYGLQVENVKEPFSAFQAVQFDEAGLLELVLSLNSILTMVEPESALQDTQCRKSFARAWSDFTERRSKLETFEATVDGQVVKPELPAFNEEEVLREILVHVRKLSSNQPAASKGTSSTGFQGHVIPWIASKAKAGDGFTLKLRIDSEELQFPWGVHRTDIESAIKELPTCLFLPPHISDEFVEELISIIKQKNWNEISECSGTWFK